MASGFERGARLFVVVCRGVDQVGERKPVCGASLFVVGDVDNRLFELRRASHIAR